MKVLVLGAGKMVEAILTGLKNETDLSQFHLYSPSGTSARELALRVGATFVQSVDDVKDPHFVWVGCKPQQLSTLAQNLKGKFPEATFVSMLAALSEAEQCKTLGVAKLVRIMPNLPVKYKKGITLCSSASAQSDLKQIINLFSSIGVARVVSEAELEELTLLTGSGPALIYEFTKLLGQSFTSLNAPEREELARMVLLGSAVSADSSAETLEEMINSVTSKAGVTIAALEKWRAMKLDELMLEGITAGKTRMEEIKASH